MSKEEPTIAGYRALLESGHAAVRGQLHTTPDDPEMLSALQQYRSIFAMMDAMTVEEEKAPLDAIDSTGIRRLARAAETSDQEVIKFLFSYRDYCEQVLRANRDSGPN